MNYFTERNGMRKPIEQTYDIDPSKYCVLLGCCEKYYDNIAWLYPKECDDELGCCGLDKYRLAAEMRYEIPDLYISSYGLIEAPGVAINTYGAGQNAEKYNQYALLDFIEFMYNNVHDINNSGCAIYYALFAVQDKRFFTPTINQILDANFWYKVPHSCDIFSEQSILGALFGQLIVPYHTNILQSKRWTYKAKETQMYMDMFVMDECRYIYDFVPTADMILDTVNDIEQQLMYRFVLDALDKNLLYYNQEWFNGNAMVGINHEGFEAKILNNRININESLQYTE